MGSPRAGQIRHIVHFCHAGDGMERRTNRTPPRKPDSGAAEGPRSASGDDLRERLRDGLDHAAAAARRWPLDHVAFSAIADGLAASYARTRKALPADWAKATPESLHDLRQRVVVHRYQMDLVVPLWPKIGRAWVSEAQKLRDRLRPHQDLAMLKDLTPPHPPRPRARSL